MELSRTEIIQKDAECNYLDLNKSNSNDILLSCVNNPNKSNPINKLFKGSLNTSIESFSSDMSSIGSGVSYVPKGSCHDGYSKDENGICVQKWRGRIRDGNWQRGHHNETMHDGKENYQICGDGQFLGLENGYIKCELSEKNEKEILGFNLTDNYMNLMPF